MGVQGIEITLVICSHNPRPEHFKRVLDAVRQQSLPIDMWELIVVDNRSDVPLAARWDSSWHPHGRHVTENELGLAAARRRAVNEASSNLLVFVDDDNILDLHYLRETIKIANNYPFLGIWGSAAIHPEFEIEPDPRLERLLPYLALRDVNTVHWSNYLPCHDATPWGAGLCVRSNVGRAYCDHYEKSSVRISGRRGNELLSGDDLEFSYVATTMGFGVGIFPELKLSHLIPKERVSLSYLLKIVEGTTVSNLLLAYKWDGREPVRMSRMLALLSLLKNALLLDGIDRQIYLARRRAAIAAETFISNSRSDETKPMSDRVD